MDGNTNLANRNLFWGLLNAFIFVLIVIGVLSTSVIIRSSNAIAPSRTITVSGEGKTKVAPDIATISFAVVSQGADAATVQAANTEKINKAIAYVKSQGVEAKDIQTSGYNLYPRYDYGKSGGNPTIVGYELNQTVTVTIRNLADASKIVGGLGGAGVNQISSFAYSVENPDKQKDVARQEAFNDARQKAEAMAAQNGVRIARVVTFSENDNNYRPPIMYAKALDGAGMGGAAPIPALEPGQEDLTVNVSVTYEIR